MSAATPLRAVLSFIKKQSLKQRKEQAADQSDSALLAALLLQIESGKQYHEGSKDVREIFDLTLRLLPPALRNVLPFPTERQFCLALSFLPAPPDAVRDLDPCMTAFAYQFFCSPEREGARRALQAPNKRYGARETIAFTQLYTPSHVVDFLLKECWRNQADGETFAGTILDPSCGAGNFLLRAFDLQVGKHLVGQERCSALLLSYHGCDIDPIGLWVTALGFAGRLQRLKISDPPALNLVLVDTDHQRDQIGSLSKAWPENHVLSRQYDCVVGNPPYIGRKLLDRDLKEHLKRQFPQARQDVCVAFLQRGLDLLKPGGRLGYITQASILYLPAYRDFRKTLIDTTQIVSVVEAGPQVFPLQSGEKVNSALIVLENQAPNSPALFVNLKSAEAPQLDASLLRQSNICIYRQQREFLKQRAFAFNFACPALVVNIRTECAKLSEQCDIRQGLATSSNGQFVRWWWQVPEAEIGHRWFPYVKGGGSERWFRPTETVIDWHNDGADIKAAVAKTYPYLGGKVEWVVKNERYYFREGLTFSLVNSRQLAVRQLPHGCIFDVGGSALFPASGDSTWLLAYLNSSFTGAMATLLNPTINYQVGDLKELPVIPLSEDTRARLATLAQHCVESKKALFAFSELAPAQRHGLPEEAVERAFKADCSAFEQARDRLVELEGEIDELVLHNVRKQFPLGADDWQTTLLMCRRAAERRKSMTTPFRSLPEYASLRLRLYLYSTIKRPTAANDVLELIGTTKSSFEYALGCPIPIYLSEHFENDQKAALKGSLRLAVQHRSNQIVLSKPSLNSQVPTVVS